MTSNKIKFLKRSIFVIDLLLTVNMFYLSYYIRNAYFGKEYGYVTHFNNYTWIMIMALFFICLFLTFLKSYDQIIQDKYYMAAFRASISIFISVIFMFAVFFFLGEKELSRLFFGIFGILELIVILIERTGIKIALHFYSKDEVHKKNVLVIGCGRLGREYFESVRQHKNLGVNIIGFLIKDNTENESNKNYNIIGTIDELEKITKEFLLDEVIIALKTEEYSNLQYILNICDKHGIRVKILPGYFEFLHVSMKLEEVFGIPMINIREVPLDSMGNRIVKRTFDVLAASMAIIIFSPLYILLAIGVKLTSPGPILFRQERVSAGNKPFQMLKFRSMCVQRKEEEKTQWTTQNDSRVTKFGSFIRRTSLDELPQFFNVLKGDMSIVGPRPERPYWVEKFKDEIPNYALRHYVKTGITGWAQVNGLRGDTSIEERINCDNYYIHNWSLRMDIKILFLTVFKGFVNRNAY